MSQITFLEAEFENKKCKNFREIFVEQMNKLIS
jgi:hypothetical protein